MGRELQRGVKPSPGRALSHKLHGLQQACTAHVTHQRVGGQTLTQLLKQVGTHLGGIRAKPFFLDDLDVRQRSCSAQWVSRVGVAVRKKAVRPRAILQRLPDLGADQRGRKRGITAAQSLGQRDQVGLDAIAVHSQHMAHAPEGGDHLVSDQKHVILAKHGLNGFPVARRWRQDAARADHRLGDECTHCFGAFLQDEPLQFIGAALREGARVGLGCPEGIRRNRVLHQCEGQVKAAVVVRQPGQACRHRGGTVVPALARNDLFLLGLADDVVVVPNQFDLRLVGVRTREAKEDAFHASTCECNQLLGQQDGLRVRGAREDVVVGQLARLLSNGVDDGLSSIAHIHTIHAGHAVDDCASVGVGDANARCTLHDALSRNPTGRKVVSTGEGVQQGVAIALLQRRGDRVAVIDHGGLLEKIISDLEI